MSLERIDKIVASNTALSRKDVKHLIKKGAVLADGSVVISSEEKFDPQKTVFSVNGKILQYKKYMYIMMNKPAGYVSATEDGREKTVTELLPEEYRARKLFPAGRLDKDTVGFMLLTDDGAFAHDILSPTKHVTKTYVLTAERKVSEAESEKIAEGMTIGGEKLLPAYLRLIKDGENPEYEIKIRQGKYHQIKRMFSEFGNKVLALKRTAFGGLELDGRLKEGECREITAQELELIKKRD